MNQNTADQFNQSGCDDFEQMIFALDETQPGELSGAVKSTLIAHLSVCDSCQQLREQERQLTNLLQAGDSFGSSAQPVMKNAVPETNWHWSRIVAVGLSGAMAASLLLIAVVWSSGARDSGWAKTITDTPTVFGSINTRPVITNAGYLASTRKLDSENYIQLPAGAVSMIDLQDTAKLSASGPATFEIDRIGDSWKVTLLSGQLKIAVLRNRRIRVSAKSGATELAFGTFLVNESQPFVHPLQEKEQQEGGGKDQDAEKTIVELKDEAMAVFSADGDSSAEAMKQCAEQLQKVIDHPDVDAATKLSAQFYRTAALANANQHQKAIVAARQFLKTYSGVPGNDVILAVLGDSLWKTGKEAEARKTWTRLLEQNPDSPYKEGILARLKSEGIEMSDANETQKQEGKDKTDDAKMPEKNSPQTHFPRMPADSDLKLMWTKDLKSPSFGGAAVADADGDGRLEIAFGTYFNSDSVFVLNAEDGSELWHHDAGTACLDASLRFFDLDTDGDLELLVPISNQGKMVAFEADTGKEIWSYQPDPIECTDSPSCILDMDGDGKVEFVYGTFHGNLHVVDGATGKIKRVYKISDEFIQTGPTAIDLNGDGTRDLVCAVMKGSNKIYATDGDTGERIWEFKVPGEHMGMYHGTSVGDLDGDGQVELVISTYDGKVYCLDASTGKKKWDADPEDSYFMSPVVIADLNNDGQMKVVAAGSHVSVIDHTGKILWSKPCAKGGYDTASRGASLADLNGDFTLDIVTLSGAGTFQVLSADGKVLQQLDASKIVGFPVSGSSHGPAIADMDGDGRLDVFFVVGNYRGGENSRGMALCLTGFQGSGRGWYMLRHDPQNTGNVHTEIDASLLRHIER